MKNAIQLLLNKHNFKNNIKMNDYRYNKTFFTNLLF